MTVMTRSLRYSLIWIIKANFALLAVDFAGLLVLSLLWQQDALVIVRNDYFAKILILESGVAFLVGGLTALSSSLFASKIREHFFSSGDRWSEDNEKKSSGEGEPVHRGRSAAIPGICTIFFSHDLSVARANIKEKKEMR